MPCTPSCIAIRAAAILLRGESVLVHRRRGESVCALPGGRVEPAESAQSAVIRELDEELGEAIAVESLVFVVENFFLHAGTEQHEVGLYFLAAFPLASKALREIATFPGVEAHAGLEFCWFERSKLGGVGLRPSFLASALARSPLEFSHVVVRPSETEL